MSRGRVGRGYEQVGIDLVPSRDGVQLGLPFNRFHLLLGRVPLKQPDQPSFSFLKFETYGTEAFSDIVRHGIQYGLHVVKRDREEKLPSRRETPGKKVMGRFAELVQLIFEFPSAKPIIKHETPEQVMSRASVKGVSYMWVCLGGVSGSVQVAKRTMIKLATVMRQAETSGAAREVGRRWEHGGGGAATVSTGVRVPGLRDRQPADGSSGRALRSRGDLRSGGAGGQRDAGGATPTNGGRGVAGNSDERCEQHRSGNGWIPECGENVNCPPCLFEQARHAR